MEVKQEKNDARSAARRRFLKILGTAGVAGAAAVLLARNFIQLPGVERPSEVTSSTTGQGVATTVQVVKDELDEILAKLIAGGPPKDGIPAIRNPKYISADQAESDRILGVLSPNDLVVGLELSTPPKAFQVRILNWHEIINDTLSVEKIVVTWCPLTGSTVGMKGKSKADGQQLSFGVSGLLYNSNLVMYDHQTDGYWPQLLGVGIRGPNKANVLSEFPVVLTTWGRWKSTHPDTLVLSTDTGYERDYDVNPYGGYDQSPSVWFPLTAQSDRFHPKKFVTGVKINREYLAIPKREFATKLVANTELGGEPIVALHDSALDTIRIFSRRLEGRLLTFAREGESIIDVETKSTWNPRGIATDGNFSGNRLRQINAIDVYWFAWYAFYPTTRILE